MKPGYDYTRTAKTVADNNTKGFPSTKMIMMYWLWAWLHENLYIISYYEGNFLIRYKFTNYERLSEASTI